MNVGVLLVTHPGIASCLMNTARNMLGQCSLQTGVLEVPLDAPLDTIQQQAMNLLDKLDQGDGVLLLSDLFGSTPCNIARSLAGRHHVQLVTGLSLPMLVRVLNYANLTLDELAQKAVSGGHDGIINCDAK
jgi:PTS system ascorbate-specific IIA component